MHVRPLLAAALVLTTLLAGCGGPSETAPNRAERDAWEREASAHGPMGVAAAFDLRGEPLHLFLQGSVGRIDAPFTISPGVTIGGQSSFYYVPNANVAARGTGLLVLEVKNEDPSKPFGATGGRLSDVEVSRAGSPFVRGQLVSLWPRMEVASPKPDARFPAGWEDANETWPIAAAVEAKLESLVLANYTRAVLVQGSNHTNLTGALAVTADRFYEQTESYLYLSAATVDADRFSLGGNVTSGSLNPSGRPAVATPKGVFGRDAELRLEPGHVRTNGNFRLTQAVTQDGLLLQSQVEVLPSTEHVSVARGEKEWVSVSYREKSFLGDAVLRDVRVTGTGQALVEVPVKRPPLLIEELWDIVFELAEDEPWAALFLAIPLALASPWILLVDAFRAIGCAFTTCPEDYPYPLWMDVGDVGVFYFKVKGDLNPGTYDATITLTGQNYPAVTIPVRITITES